MSKKVRKPMLVLVHLGCVCCCSTEVRCALLKGEASQEYVWGQLGGAWAGENSGNFKESLLIKAIKPRVLIHLGIQQTGLGSLYLGEG